MLWNALDTGGPISQLLLLSTSHDIAVAPLFQAKEEKWQAALALFEKMQGVLVKQNEDGYDVDMRYMEYLNFVN